MKKKIMSLMLLCMMVAALTACGGNKKGDPTLVYELPDGFTEQAEGMYYAPDYPSDTSNIYIQSSENDPFGVNYTEDQFIELVTQTYEAQGFEISDMNMNEFTTGKLDDYETLLIDCSYTLGGIEIAQIEFIVQIDKTTYVFTYTQGPGSDWNEAFHESVKSMAIEYK